MIVSTGAGYVIIIILIEKKTTSYGIENVILSLP